MPRESEDIETIHSRIMYHPINVGNLIHDSELRTDSTFTYGCETSNLLFVLISESKVNTKFLVNKQN